MKVRVQFEGRGRRATRVESIRGTLAAVLRETYHDTEEGVQGGIARATRELQTDWRRDVRQALGLKLARSIRKKVYPEQGASISAAGLVWSRAPKVIGAHEKGALIRARSGLWLAIPTEAAGRQGRIFRDMGSGQFAALTPARWENATGAKLRFVPRDGRSALLVMDQARLNKRGHAAPNRRRRRQDGILTSEVTVPIFVMIRQVRLPKRLDLEALARANINKVPGYITRSWPRG